MRDLPATPSELRALLVQLFPAFDAATDGLEPMEPEEIPYTFHTVMFDFAPFFAKHQTGFSPRQLERFAQFLVRASASEGSLENAISTCFLEHTRQLKVNRALQPWLAKARSK